MLCSFIGALKFSLYLLCIVTVTIIIGYMFAKLAVFGFVYSAVAWFLMVLIGATLFNYFTRKK